MGKNTFASRGAASSRSRRRAVRPFLEIGDVESRLHLKDRTRAQDVRRGARRAARRSQAADEADAALLGGEGLGEARRGRDLRLADFVEDHKQRAKYMHTAAIVASRQLQDLDKAIEYYEQVLELQERAAFLLEGDRIGKITFTLKRAAESLASRNAFALTSLPKPWPAQP